MSEKTKTDDEILKSKFEELNEADQERFNDLNIEIVNKKYSKLIPKNSRTHTIALENGIGCILHHPKPNILSKAVGAMSGINGDPDMYKAGCAILTNCWIVGDKQIEVESDERFAAAMQALSIIEVMQGHVKKN